MADMDTAVLNPPVVCQVASYALGVGRGVRVQDNCDIFLNRMLCRLMCFELLLVIMRGVCIALPCSLIRKRH